MEDIMNKRESTLGIDFGTSNTVVTYFDRDKFVNFNGENGEPYVKSVVAYNNDNKLIIDRGAHKLSNPAFRARNVKYLLGRNAKECEDVHDIPYEADIKYANEQPILVYKKKDKEISKTPEEVVTTFIKELKTRVERKVGRQFTNVVLTVPTTFRTKQKSALKKAARDAGLNVIGLYSEPTAAGVHYQLSLHTKSKGVFLVFDFGGGTLDLSLMYCKNNVYSTLASAGNYHLGGNDIDGKIVEYVEREYNTGGRPLFEGESDNVRRRKQKLCEAAEEVKIKLQGSDDTAIEVIEYEDDTGEPQECYLTNAQLDKQINIPMDEIKITLRDLARQFVREYDEQSVGGFRVSKDDDPEGTLQAIVSNVILVGGSSKMKAVRRLLKDYFGDKIFVDEDTQLCVSKGAMEAMFKIEDPLKSVREVIFHKLLVKADGCQIGVVPRGTSIPFEMASGMRQQRNRSTIEVQICEVIKDKETDEEMETVLVEGNVPVERSFAQTQPYLQVKISVNLEGMITAIIHNPLTGKEMHVGTGDIWCVC